MENSELSIGFNNIKVICKNKDRKDGSICKEPELIIDNKRYPLSTKISDGGVELKLNDFNQDNNLDLFFINYLGTGTSACMTEGYLYSVVNSIPKEIFHDNHEDPIKYIDKNISFEVDNKEGSYYITAKKEGKVVGVKSSSQEELHANEIITENDVGPGGILHYHVRDKGEPKIQAEVGIFCRTIYFSELILTYSYIDGHFIVDKVEFR